jgi:hypothetical protein
MHNSHFCFNAYKMRHLATIMIAMLMAIQPILLFASQIIDESVLDVHQKGTKVAQITEEPKVQGTKGSMALIPIPISNPTIGIGLGGVAMYMHPKAGGNENTPTSSTGIFGMYTDSRSWAVGAFHDGYYLNDRIRSRVPIGHGSINLKFYGIGNDSPLHSNPIEYNAEANFTTPRLLYRLHAGNWFLGGQYRFMQIKTTSELGEHLPVDPDTESQTQTSGIGLVTVYDSRNSNYWPTKGAWLDATLSNYSENLGGDYDYQKLIMKWAQYFPLNDTWLAVYRIDGQMVNGSAPFWDLSHINLRGYPIDQFVDNTTVTVQAELRWNFFRRWTVVAFGGAARIADTVGDIGSVNTLPAAGGGAHFMLKEKEKLSIGIDVAKGEGESVTMYFQIGDYMAK